MSWCLACEIRIFWSIPCILSAYFWIVRVFLLLQSTISVFAFCNCAEMYTNRMFQLLLSAYSTISIRDTALFLGMSEENATNCKHLTSPSIHIRNKNPEKTYMIIMYTHFLLQIPSLQSFRIRISCWTIHSIWLISLVTRAILTF